MKNVPFPGVHFVRGSISSAAARLCVVCALLFFGGAFVSAREQERQIVPNKVSALVTNLTPLRHSSRWNPLNLSIGLPLRDRAGLTSLLQQLYDPQSTNFHHFLTPAQFADRFGPTEQDYQTVVNFAQSHGLVVTGRYSNRTLVGVRGSVADVERVLHVTINEYQHPTEARTFYAPSGAPTLDLAVPVLAIAGLDNFFLPRPCLKPVPAGQVKPALTGSGPNGAYLGNDFRAAYVPGETLTGSGQTVGLFELDSGYYQSDITAYEDLAGLPNVPVKPVLLDNYNGGPGFGNDEVSLDIEMAISLAPGLKDVLVYEGSSPDDVLNRMASDDLARQIGASWTYSTDASTEQAFLQFAAQGQSYFNASGDSDAYPGVIDTPADDPNITIVGGTTLTTQGPGGAWASETVWNWGGGTGSSGGISTVNPIPGWQRPVDMSANQGSITMRNLPDVALTADNVYIVFGNGKSGPVGGTSCATPLWAAFIALANELALTNGEPAVGFVNPAIYRMGLGSNAVSYTALFHDITTGNNESTRSPGRFLAVPGYDLCTGWGTPRGGSLLTALALPEPLRIFPAGPLVFSGPVGGPFSPASQTYALTNSGGGALSWSLANTSSWFNVSPVSGSLARGGRGATVTLSVASAATNFPPGAFPATFEFSNRTDKFVQDRSALLAVVTPPVIAGQPVNQALLEGQTATFGVSIATNALMYYQWQLNGANLIDAGEISGSLTSTLTVSNVTLASVGAYSVILSNAAGVLASSNALLTIVPSAPVITVQPANQTVLAEAPASFSVAAVGNTPYAYNWRLNGTNLINGTVFSGVTRSTLVVSNVTTANTGIYTVQVGNSLGTVVSTGAVLSVIPVTASGVAMATLSSFPGNNSPAYPYGPLAQGTDKNLYGTTFEGGIDGVGTIFKMTTNGTVTTLHSFNFSDGGLPYAGLFQAKGGLLFGAAYFGGQYGDGTLFEISHGGVFRDLAGFNGENGASPAGGLTVGIDGNYYGTTESGGDYGDGTVFRMTALGALTSVVSFNGFDGDFPSSVLVQGSDGSFYGTTEDGGTNGGQGTVFKLTPGGTLTPLYMFSGASDGAIPIAGLAQGGNGNFYGVTYLGGADGYGTVFEISPAGAFTLLYTFTGGADGGNPWGGLCLANDGNLYGVTQDGGAYGAGTVFQIAPSGTLTTLVQFENYNGANPAAALIQGSDGFLYGTTQNGGSLGNGTIFRFSLSGPLQITGQPSDQPVYLGGTAVFTVATSGSSPVAYQWQQDGVNLSDGGNISGSSTSTLRITNVSLADAALYSVVVSNAYNVLTSDDGVLEVIYSPPVVVTQPASRTCVAGTTATFSVTALGDQPLSYQWQENGVNLTEGGTVSGSSSSTLTLAQLIPGSGGAYSVIVSNAFFGVSSAKALLTVVPSTTPSVGMASLRNLSGAGDGAFPYGGLVQGKDGNLYGMTEKGGSSFYGTIFRMSPAGGLVTYYSFDGVTGGNPYDRLVQGTNGLFYGTTSLGGTNGYGSVFQTTVSAPFKTLYSFTGGLDGSAPQNGLIQGSDGNFYGASDQGGAYSAGSIYRISAKGIFTNLYEFSGLDDGGYPFSDLVQGRDGRLYGTTESGGDNYYGTVFSLDTNGTLTTLISFNFTNGAYPAAGVIQGPDGNLYGATYEGGAFGNGAIFSVSTNGSLTTLYSFDGTNGSSPAAALVPGSDGNFYGTASSGGIGGRGVAFRISTDGAMTPLLWFDGQNGAGPESALVQASNGSFFGTTPFGGIGFNPSAGGGYGSIFRFTVPLFIHQTFSAAPAVACLPYSASLTNDAVAPAGDVLGYAKVAGPAWLLVATNGALAGTPTNSDIGTNIFVVSLTDNNGVTASATVNLVVTADPPPSFISDPMIETWANLDEPYLGTIGTNGTAPYLNVGDSLTFSKVGGPAWLNVGADGTLSGTPEGPEAGSNEFLVAVTDLGGASNTASLFLYVNSPPVFQPQAFAKPAATIGLLYSGTIATNATDPDLAAGDSLAFYKVTGPDWLAVAGNGALSGVPTSTNSGPNSFLVLVIDSNGLAGIGSLGILVSEPVLPTIVSSPFSGPPVNAGQLYSATLATNVSDSNFGDQLTFSKVTGPSWLNIAGNGVLSGMPLSANAGTNFFVVSVTDLTGLSTNMTLLINVTAIPIQVIITKQGGNITLGWSGGIPPYQVLTSTNLNNPTWQNWGSPVNATNLMLSPSNSGMFYQIKGQ